MDKLRFSGQVGHSRLSHFPVSGDDIRSARTSDDFEQIARVLKKVATSRSNVLFRNDDARVARMADLFKGLSSKEIDQLRSTYQGRYGCDPEMHIRSDALGLPIGRPNRQVELAMLTALNGPKMKEHAQALLELHQKARSGTLTERDRGRYFSMLPSVGLWAVSVRHPDDPEMDSAERIMLRNAWRDAKAPVALDEALKEIESALPPPDLFSRAPREKSIAVVISSKGAQWQELMDWAMKMDKEGFHLQMFTPEGRPVGFQRDSLTVSKSTARLGFGCPPHLDPGGEAGDVARQLLEKTAGAKAFDPSKFGAVYLVGGLGFNEDIAVAMPKDKGNKKGPSELTAQPDILKMMTQAVSARLPIVGICHAPTLLAAVPMQVNGRTEMVNTGVATASLPPFEAYVGRTGRKEPHFSYDVNTHNVLEATGGKTSLLKDLAKMNRVVRDHKDGLDIITGPGPLAAAALASATIESIQKRWGRPGGDRFED